MRRADWLKRSATVFTRGKNINIAVWDSLVLVILSDYKAKAW